MCVDVHVYLRAMDGCSSSALAKAVTRGHVNIARLLLDRGAPVEAASGPGVSANT